MGRKLLWADLTLVDREGSGSYRVSLKFLREVRAKLFEEQVLTTKPWSDGFTIWGAGKVCLVDNPSAVHDLQGGTERPAVLPAAEP